MPNQPISHEWWRSFLMDLAACCIRASTSIKVRELPTKKKGKSPPAPTSYEELDIVRGLPLIDFDYELHPQKTIRLRLLECDQSLRTVEIESPQTISLLDVEHEFHALNTMSTMRTELIDGAFGDCPSPTGLAFCVETPHQIYTVVIIQRHS